MKREIIETMTVCCWHKDHESRLVTLERRMDKVNPALRFSPHYTVISIRALAIGALVISCGALVFAGAAFLVSLMQR